MPRLTDEQKAARRKVIGSSDVAELLGISPYDGASPVRLFAEKTGLLGDEDEEEDDAKELGHLLEGPLVSFYERKSGYRVARNGPFVETVKHPRLSFAAANLDGRIIGKSAALEVKLVGIGMAKDWDLLSDDGIPNYVRVQAAWQHACAELDEVHVVGMIAGASGFRVWYVPRDNELIAILEKAAGEFWETYVVPRVCPPLDSSKASRLLLEKLYPPPPEDVVVEAPPEVVAIGDRRQRAHNAAGEAEQIKDTASALIIEAMGKAGATVMWCPTWRATYRPNKKGNRTLTVTSLGAPVVRRPKMNAASLRDPHEWGDDGEAF